MQSILSFLKAFKQKLRGRGYLSRLDLAANLSSHHVAILYSPPPSAKALIIALTIQCRSSGLR